MAFLFILVIFVLLFPVLGATLGWLLLRRVSLPLAWIVGVLAGVAPVAVFAGAIYRGEGDGLDPDPLLFLQLSIGVAALVALTTLIGCQVWIRRPE